MRVKSKVKKLKKMTKKLKNKKIIIKFQFKIKRKNKKKSIFNIKKNSMIWFLNMIQKKENIMMKIKVKIVKIQKINI